MNLSMLTQHNYLGPVRKKTALTQIDVGTTMQLSDLASVSRWENGLREPTFEALILYELLFDLPISHFFARQKNELIPKLAEGIMKRIEELKSLPADSSVPARVEYLQATFTRLAALPV